MGDLMGGLLSRRSWLFGLAAIAASAGACGHGQASRSARPVPPSVARSAPSPQPGHPVSSTRAASPTSRRTPPTTAWAASAPQPSPDAAASRLVGAWAAADRLTAATVAAPAAVTTLFKVPYPGAGLAIPRGCSSGFPPIVCTYGPPGGASPTDALFEISVAQLPSGWYVTSVRTLS
jgi:hypothetical protein